MTKDKVKPSRTAGLGTRIQEEIHQAAKVYSAKTNKSLAELIEAGLQQQMGMGVVKINLGIVTNKLKERSRFYDMTERELDRAVELVLKFAHPDDPNETVQDLLGEYGVWSKLYDQTRAELTAISSYVLAGGALEDTQGKVKFDLISGQLSDKLGEFRVQRLYPLLDMAVEHAAESL